MGGAEFGPVQIANQRRQPAERIPLLNELVLPYRNQSSRWSRSRIQVCRFGHSTPISVWTESILGVMMVGVYFI